MSVTNYYSVNGVLLGEESVGSGRTDYLADSLGSVTATADQAGTAQNTYRYKPYGALLAKTGIASDPAFTWVASYGYRQTNRTVSEVYVRARHYSAIMGRWTTEDPIGFQDSVNVYRYGSDSPSLAIDPSGRPSILFVAREVSCNHGTLTTNWIQPDIKPGWIVQHVLFAYDITDCSGKRINSDRPSGQNCWEAWSVDRRGRINPSPEDNFYTGLLPQPSKGTIYILGLAKSVKPNYVTTPPFFYNNVKCHPGGLPSSTTKPPHWLDAGTVIHALLMNWDCCACKQEFEICTIPNDGKYCWGI